MLTCTVSMVETSIAIIAASLPSIKTLIYHVRSTNASSGRHYELSSHRMNTHTQNNTQIVAGSRASRLGVGDRNKTHQMSNDSDEDLFAKAETSSHIGSFSEHLSKEGIVVSSTYAVASETDLPPVVETRTKF